MAYKAVYPQGRTQGAGGGVGSDVVEVRLAFHPTALPAPSFGSLVHPSPMARGVMWKPAPGGMWEPKRLTAVVHRRAGFLRPSPSVPIRGSRRGGGELRLLCRLLGSACFAVRCAGCSVALALLLGAGERERLE